MDFLNAWVKATWSMTLEAAPWLLFGFVLAGVVYVLLPTEKVVKHLGRPGLGSVLKAALIGVPLPLCSCSVIPVASSIRRRGATRGATASFLISTPESGVDSIAISYALLGPLLAVVRPIAAFISAALAGTLIAGHERRSAETAAVARPPAEEKADCSCCCSQSQPVRASFGSKITQALRYGCVEMFSDLAHWLVLGFVLAGLVAAILPDDFLEASIGTGLIAMLAMLLAGLPLYVCATSATPVAAALIAKGLSPGAALVFLLVGPATNMATMVVVARDLGRWALAMYLGSIAVVSIALGLVVNVVAGELPGAVAAESAMHEHGVTTLNLICGVVLGLLLLNGLRVRIVRRWAGRRVAAAGGVPVGSFGE